MFTHITQKNMHTQDAHILLIIKYTFRQQQKNTEE